MREELERSFFPFVIKPGRYAGGEPGRIAKSANDRLLYLHAFPDLYEKGIQDRLAVCLYHIINRDDRFVCEQVFSPDRDARQILRDKKIALFSVDSFRPVYEFDVIGFSLPHPKLYVNVLAMIHLAGIPLLSGDRDDTHPLITGLDRGAVTPEPLAPFCDIFLPGDAEEALPELLGEIHTMKDAPRKKVLEHLQRKCSSVYIPSFFDDDRKPLFHFVPETVRAQRVSNLRAEYYPTTPIVPLIEISRPAVEIETARATHLFGNDRQTESGDDRGRPLNDILRQAADQIVSTGYDSIRLHDGMTAKELEPVVLSLAQQFASQRVSVSVEELHPRGVTPRLLDALGKGGRSAVTIGICAATSRLRDMLGVRFSDDDLFNCARLIIEKGWKTIHLSVCFGLPGEDESDLRAIAGTVNKVADIFKERPEKGYILLELKPFLPFAHTPFQWDEACEESDLTRRLGIIRRSIRARNVQLRHPDLRMASVSCAIARGGRELALVLQTACELDCQADGDAGEDNSGIYRKAFEKHGVNISDLLKAKPFDDKLAWSHISTENAPETLAELRRRSSPPTMEDTKRQVSVSGRKEVLTSGFGRGKKKLASRSVAAPTKNRVRIRWGKSARFRYMSHLDNIRLHERSLRRASIPVAWSQGQNPRMKLSSGPPLPLGFTSETELLDIELETNLAPDMIDRLQGVLPEGIRIFEATMLYGNGPSLSAFLNRAVYTLPLSLWTDITCVERSIERLMSSVSLIHQRDGKHGPKEIDLRPGIYELDIVENRLSMTLGIGQGELVRPTEVAGYLTESLTLDIPALPFHRLKLFREEPVGTVADPMVV